LKNSNSTPGVIDNDYVLNQAQLQQILKLMHAVNGISSVTKLITTMEEALQEIVPCIKSIVWIYDNNKKLLWSFDGKKKIFADTDKCVAGKAFKEQNIVHITNPSSDELFNDYTDKIPGAATGHLLCVPFSFKENDLYGVIQLMNTLVHPFTRAVINLTKEWSRLTAGVFSKSVNQNEFKKAFDSFVDTISHALDTRDFITSGHSRRVTLYAVEVAKQMGLSRMDIEILRYAGLLHDIGKIGVPELILLKDKRPTEDEFQIIKRHAGLTRSILEKIHFPGNMKKIVEMAATHHERLNGTGYPDGLKGDEIPRGGKILAVCDVFDSLSSRRTYEDRLPIKTVVNVLDDEVSEAFEPFIVYHFKNVPLDRVVQIMEYGHTANFEDTDIEYLANFTLNDLINADQIKTDEQQKMLNVFSKYYSRQYRG